MNYQYSYIFPITIKFKEVKEFEELLQENNLGIKKTVYDCINDNYQYIVKGEKRYIDFVKYLWEEKQKESTMLQNIAKWLGKLI